MLPLTTLVFIAYVIFLIVAKGNWLGDVFLYLFLSYLVIEIKVLSKKRRKEMLNRAKKTANNNKVEILGEERVDVYLTAWNDQESIGYVVEDFIRNKKCNKVIVIDNNSSDNTREIAMEKGAECLVEFSPGYGKVVMRSIVEGARGSSNYFIICEGDGTFVSEDLDKFLAYKNHAEVINGTRIQEQLRELDTQLTNFIYLGNFFAAKLLELKHFGKATLTDLGTTYKLMSKRSAQDLIPKLNSSINHEFNAHFLDMSLQNNLAVVEVPIVFRKRIGVSKGGNRSNLYAFKVGVKMIFGIISNWFLSSRTVESEIN